MVTYATDRRLKSADCQFSIRLTWDDPISLGDFSQIIKDIEKIFAASSKEVSSRLKVNNAKKLNAILTVHEFKTGSLEIVLDPYFSGVMTGVAANAVCAVFVYVMRRVNGRPLQNEREPLNLVDKTIIAEDKLNESASDAVQASSKHRKALNGKQKAFGIEISIKLNNKDYEIGSD